MLLVLLLAGSADAWAQCSTPSCRTSSVALNTGLNPATGTPFAIGMFDTGWEVISDPDPNTTEVRLGSAMNGLGGWTTQPNSRWLWSDFGTSNPTPGSVTYRTRFQMCVAGAVTVNFNVCIPQGGQVRLNGSLLIAVPAGLGLTSFSSTVPAITGINSIEIIAFNPAGTYAAANMTGTVSSVASSLITRECGPYNNGVTLLVFDDLNQNGIQDFGEPPVSGIPVDLISATGTQTAFSTGTGRVWFLTGIGTVTAATVPSLPWMVVAGTTQTLTLPLGGLAAATGLKAAITTCPTVDILKFNDFNCNGVRDGNEPALGGWTINFSNGQSGVTLPGGPRSIKVCGSTTFTVSEVIPANTCWVQTYPGGTGIHTITLIPGKWTYKAYFGNSSTGTLCIKKFNDLDGDGHWGDGEPGLPNWTFNVTTANFNTFVQTGSDGTVCISVTCGTYTICESLQSGWCPTTPPCQIVTVAACSVTTAVFGNTESGQLCVHKFNDRNCNGHQELPGEENLSDWEFTLDNGIDPPITVITGPTGVTCATVTPGDWTICETPKDGWAPATTACCPSYCTTITLPACQTVIVTFGNASTGTVCAFKYNDVNGNGEYDPGTDSPMAGWTIELVLDNGLGPVYVSGQTDASGYICFYDVPLGEYLLREIQQPGWVATEPHPLDLGYYITVTPCCSIDKPFGNRNCETGICVHKFNDRNCNGQQELPGEENLSDWEFTLDNGIDPPITVITGPTGVTCATVTPGDWTICETPKDGWAPATTACCPSYCTTITVSTCQTVIVTFGNASTGTVCAFKYNDVNGNGEYDPGTDSPMAGWTIELVLDNGLGPVYVSGQTDASGYVCFFDVPLGEYLLREIQQPGWVATEPHPLDLGYYITVTPCCSIDKPFGNHHDDCKTKICITKFNDKNCDGSRQDGEEYLPGWTFKLTSSHWLGADISVTTGTTGVTCATLPGGGPWVVCETVQPGWTSTNGPCRTVTVATCSTVDVLFGNASTGTLCITKFNDANCNGTRDAGELTVPNWKFTVTTTGGTPVTSGTTTTSGTVCLSLPAGNYIVCEEIRACWEATNPASGCLPVTISTCNTTQALFGNSSTGTLCITKYHDLNCNGKRDAGEPGLPGWPVNISGIGTVLTATNGTICIPVICGTYTVCEQMLPGWVLQPGGSTCQTVVVTPCDITQVTFGNCQCTTSICVTKFNDKNCNGTYEPGLGETVIPGWTITVTGTGGAPVIVSGVTGSAGDICFPVPSGTYEVHEVMPAVPAPGCPWVQTYPIGTTGRPYHTVTVGTCTIANVAFGNSSTGTICVFKFDDINCNTIYEPGLGERPIPGWRFSLVTGATVITVYTDANGKACASVTCGQWKVCEEPRACWVPTTPGGVCQDTYVLPCSNVELVFGNSSTGTLCINKFNDANCNGKQESTELGVAGWNFIVTRPNGTNFIATTLANGTICVPVTCGTYTVCEVTRACWRLTTPWLCTTVTVTPCQTSQVTFGNSSTGTVCITKYNDLNGNGKRDAGEPFLPGWTFNIAGVGNVTTATGGTVCVPIPCGTYTICEVTQAGWTPTTPVCVTINVVPCQVVQVTFGNRQGPCTGRICGTKYWERQHGGGPLCDGIRQPDETGLGKWTIQITEIGGSGFTATVTTDKDGNYCVTVPAGTYQVTEILKWGFMQTFPMGGGGHIVTVNCDDVVPKIDFINCACPQPPGGTGCIADSIPILSDPTVFNGHTTLIATPPGVPGVLPRDGTLLPPGIAPPLVPVPGAQFIGPTPAGPINPPGVYLWRRYFCVCPFVDSTSVRIRLCFEGVHQVNVRLNGMLLGTYTYPNAPTCIDTTVVIGNGCQYLEFEQIKLNQPPPPAALSYRGSIVGPALIKDSCCSCYYSTFGGVVGGPSNLQSPQDDAGSNRSHDAQPGGDANDGADASTTDAHSPMMSAFNPELISVPNPTNGATTVSYSLWRNGDVQLALYNAVGRHVMTISEGFQTAGRYNVPLDMSELPSGFYHLRLTVGGKVYTLRLVNAK